jgi:predicted nucleic acid-binding protein
MKYVLDASVALKWVLPEPLSDKARQVRDDYQKQIHELLAPDIFPAELAHSLNRAERRKIIASGHAAGFLADILQTSPVIHPYLSLLARAVDISSQEQIGVYDCLCVALAEHEQCEFLTADDRLIRSLQGRFAFIVSLASFP